MFNNNFILFIINKNYICLSKQIRSHEIHHAQANIKGYENMDCHVRFDYHSIPNW